MADFSVGSYCSKLTKLDAIEPNLTSGFLHTIEVLYTNSGCTAFFDMISSINSLPYPSGCTAPQAAQQSNPLICLEIARRKARKDFCECMLIQNCGFEEKDFGIKYGCMDNGDRDLSYINNRGTWDFLLQNNTTSSGVVARPDGTQLPGLQMGSAYPPPLIPSTQFPYPPVPALNYDIDATVDIGNCVYVDNYHTGNPTGGLPYHLEGCMNSTPDPMGGYPDINGHGTGAVYDCPSSPGGPSDLNPNITINSLTNPTIPDPCTYPCAPGQGYEYSNYDPCANFSCSYPSSNALPPYSSDPQYATDYNIGHTYWDTTNITSYKFGSNWNYANLYMGGWGPFGYQGCCIAPELPTPNPDITYDFRPVHPTIIGGIQMFSTDDPSAIGIMNSSTLTSPDRWKIGGTYFHYQISRWDVVGNSQFPWNNADYRNTVVYGAPSTIPVTPAIPAAGCCQIPGQPIGTFYLFPPSSCGVDTETLRIYIYDVYKNLIWDGEYKFLCTDGMSTCPLPPSRETCWGKPPPMKLVTEHYSITPGQIIDLALIGDVTGVQASSFGSGASCCYNFPTGIGQFMGPKNGVGYVRIDSNISGTTVDTNNILPPGSAYPGFAPRIPSTHWITPRGNTANLTNMWTGQNLNWDAANNPFTPGTQIPHACHDCVGGGYGKYVHYLEPGSATWTPGDFFYNNPFLLPNASSVHPDYATATTNCPRAMSIIGGGGDSGINLSLGDCEEAISIKTNITYNKDENQNVTWSSADTATPISTQALISLPTPSIPSPTTPPPTTMTGGSGY